MNQRYFRVSANINLDSIKSNISNLKKLLHENVKMMVVIKADGYGHGAVPVAHALDDMVYGYATAILEEAVELREAGISKPVLILGYTSKEFSEIVVKYDLSQTVFSYDAAYALNEAAKKIGKKARIHIKIDTGMSRIGFRDDVPGYDDILKISKLPNLYLEGIFTHFAKADEAEKAPTKLQFERFTSFCDKLAASGVSFSLRHASNSAAIIDSPEMNLDMVRCGICTYGLYPSDEVQKTRVLLKPAMELKTHVSFVKTVPAGCGISYNGTFVSDRTMRVATVPVGYGDGYPRLLSSKGRVLIHGKSAPILGRICMDQFMVDVSNIPECRQDDEVTLLGRDGEEQITLEEMSEYAGIFNYEFLCNVGKRIPRVYFDDGKIIYQNS